MYLLIKFCAKSKGLVNCIALTASLQIFISKLCILTLLFLTYAERINGRRNVPPEGLGLTVFMIALKMNHVDFEAQWNTHRMAAADAVRTTRGGQRLHR